MDKPAFLDYLADHIVLFDGAMGTQLYARGIYINRCFDEINLSNPALVKEIHAKYIAAGADVIETNTFSANRIKLGRHGLAEDVSKINLKGAQLAKEAAGDQIWVAGSVGPLGERLEPWGTISASAAKEIFQEQIKALVKGRVDLIILETFYDFKEIHQAFLAAKEVCDLPVIVQMTLDEQGETLYGIKPAKIAAELSSWAPDVMGLNCSVGPQIMLTALEEMVRITHIPLSVQPNAGFPQDIDGRNIYLSSPEYMAEYARRFVKAGAKLVGGCCGTTPEHIRAMRSFIKSVAPHAKQITVKSVKDRKTTQKPIPFEQKSSWANKIAQEKFVISVEMVPPKGIDTNQCISIANQLAAKGVDAINIPDGPRALSRMGSVFLGKALLDHTALEPILHYTSRDRNLLGIMSDFLGIQVLGIRNLLLITGDPPKMGDYPDATAVFDIDSIGLINLVNHLNRGIDIGGNSIGEPTEYVLGVGVNPGATDWEYELDRLTRKVDSGAEFIMTQPIFDTERFHRFLDKIETYGLPVVAGIWPLVSIRNAEFMNNEVPGVVVPEKIMQRMRATRTKQAARETGIDIAHETIREIYQRIVGVQIAMPFNKVDYPLKIIEAVQELSPG